METTKKEPRTSKDQSTSAMGTMQGARRATGIVPMAGASTHLVNPAPDPEVPEKRPRRKFTAKYKLRILGLRPIEICRITLDNISFRKAELNINWRKFHNPLKLPLPEVTIKAIAAYIIGARPKSALRTLFLSLMPPYGPITPTTITHHFWAMTASSQPESICSSTLN